MPAPSPGPLAWIAPADAGEIADLLGRKPASGALVTGAAPPGEEARGEGVEAGGNVEAERAAGTRWTAGSGPEGGGEPGTRVLSTHRLSETIENEPEDLLIRVGSGTRVRELRRRLAREGRWLPPATFARPGGGAGSCGGLVGAAPPTPADAAYGPVRRQVLACDTVSRDGRRLRWGRGVVKNVAGYDLPRLWVGSHGRLGVVVDVTFRTWPAPARLRRYALPTAGSGASAALEVLEALATVPASESFEPDAVLWRAPRDLEESGARAAWIWLLGSAASVKARERRLLRWSRERALRVRREADEPFDPSSPALAVDGAERPGPAVGRDPGGDGGGDGGRPFDGVVLHVTVPRPRLAGAVEGMMEASGARGMRLAAHPASGLIRCEYRRARGEGGLASALARAGGKGGRIAVARGGPAEHRAAEARRPAATRALEARVVAALGGGKRSWPADYV